MLCLTRRTGERIRIGDHISVSINHASGPVQLGIEAPKEIKIMREEIMCIGQEKTNYQAAYAGDEEAVRALVEPELRQRPTLNKRTVTVTTSEYEPLNIGKTELRVRDTEINGRPVVQLSAYPYAFGETVEEGLENLAVELDRVSRVLRTIVATTETRGDGTALEN